MVIYAIGHSNMALSALFPTMCPRYVTCPPDLVGQPRPPCRYREVDKMCLPDTHLTRTLTYYCVAYSCRCPLRLLVTAIFDIAIGFGG